MTLEKETSIYQLGAIAAGIEGAVSIAESKNSIFHQATAPPTSGRKVGDIWYDSDDGFAMYKFDGTGWTQEQFGTNAISAGSVTAARLDAQDVYTNFLRVYFLSAAQAEIESLSAITANLGSVIVGGLNNEDGVITIKDASNQTIGYWDNTGINAQAGHIGNWEIVGGSLHAYENDDLIAAIGPGTGVAFYNEDGLGDVVMWPYGRIVARSTHQLNQLFWELEDTLTNNDTKISPGRIVCTVPSGQALVYASNIDNGNRIFIYADGSNGQAGLYSYSADGTARPILIRANNSNAIATYGDWGFIPWKKDIRGTPIISDSSDGHRVSLLTCGASGQVGIQAQFGSTGTTYSIGYFNVAASDIRLKKNIKNSTVTALPLINSIHMRAFDWKQDERHQSIGFVADELEKLDKNLAIGGGTNEDGTMNIKSVDTFYLLGYAIKAIQELSAEVKKLKGVA